MTTGSRTRSASADRGDVLPAPAVEAAGEPHDGPLGLEDLGPGQQVLRDRTGARRRRCRRARAGTATRPASRPAGRWRRRSAARRRGRRARSSPADVPSTTMQNTAAALAPASMPMMSGLASGLRARLWKMAPEMPKAGADQQAGEGPGQAQRADDELGVVGADAEERRHHVAQRDREVADADRDAERRRTMATEQAGDDRRRAGTACAPSARGRTAPALRARRADRSSVTAPPACAGGRAR